MAKKKVSGTKAEPKATFSAILRSRSLSVQQLAKRLRGIVFEEIPDAQETFFGKTMGMALYRSTSEVCGIQPCDDRCNFYFSRGVDLTDNDRLLEGTGKSIRHLKIQPDDDIDTLPLRDWIRETVKLNAKTVGKGPTYQQVLKKLQKICLALPDTKETLTWGKPHFRVGEKIFCGCGEGDGRIRISMKADRADQQVLIKLPGIEKAAYVGNSGWISIDPAVFAEWDEIENLIVDSFRLIAPKRTVARLDSEPVQKQTNKKAGKRKTAGKKMATGKSLRKTKSTGRRKG